MTTQKENIRKPNIAIAAAVLRIKLESGRSRPTLKDETQRASGLSSLAERNNWIPFWVNRINDFYVISRL